MTNAQRIAYHCVQVDREDPIAWVFACVDSLAREGKLASAEAAALLTSIACADDTA